AAGEIGHLGMLSTRPRFRKAIDARKYSKAVGVNTDEVLKQMQASLKPEAWERFESLRNRCLRLEQLAQQFRGIQASEQSTVKDFQTNSLERLLWMFLKLLYSLDALNLFLRGTNRVELAKQFESSEKELKAAQESKRSEKVTKSLQDKLDTLRQRLDNYDKTLENRDFLAIELDRIEQKVNAISEMAINSRDAADFSAQVDGITEGIAATEEAMRSLDVAPVLEREDHPSLLRRATPPPLLTQRK
ncbi:MAG: hypothetical protein WC655_24595, partial [Candidatus Hydrogenedentales bacterium]